MKKLLTIVLSMVMVMSMTAVSFADEATVEKTYEDMEQVTITKWYNNENNGVSPAETFNFKIDYIGVTEAGVTAGTVDNKLPEVASVTFNEGDAGKVVIENGVANYLCSRDIVVTLPTYTGVGIYEYKITEDPGTMAGVNYYASAIKMVVTVIQDDNGLIRVAAVHTEAENEEKDDNIVNEYWAGQLTVGKNVIGILGDRTKDFTVKVTFNAPDGETVGAPIKYIDSNVENTITAKAMEDGTETVEITLKDDETVTFTNIPYGVTYVVEEVVPADYEATYDGNETGTIDSAEKATTVTNAKGGTVDTGIILDNGLYIVLLAGVAAAAGMFFMKRRQDEYDM